MRTDMDTVASRSAATAVSKLFSGEVPSESNGPDNPWESVNREFRDEAVSDLHLWADLEALAEDEEVLEFVDPKLLRGKPRRSAARWAGLAMAAGLVLSVFAVLWLVPAANRATDDAARYVARIGEVKNVSLADGSQISINTGSEVLFVDGADQRTLLLQRGEIFVNVAKDESRPFVVKSGQNAITVLGTAFSVRQYPERLEIAVVEGVVASHPISESLSSNLSVVSGQDEPVVGRQVKIPAGWQVDIAASDNRLIASVAVTEGMDPGWTSGVLSFKREELYKVVKELNRYSAKKILIEDKSIMDLTASAVIKVDSLNVALTGLEVSLPIKVTHHFDKIVITKK